jgi:hypothetical protein
VRHGGGAERLDYIDLENMIFAQARCPARKLLAYLLNDNFSAVELDAVALAVVEADGLDLLEALERPGEAGGRILPAGKED